MIKFRVELLKDGAKLPTKAKKDDACFDIYTPEDFTLEPGETIGLGTGLKVGLEPGWEIQIRSRSSVGIKRRVNLIHKVGTIDAGYRNEIFLPLINESNEVQSFKSGDRVAQMKIAKVPEVELEIGYVSNDTERGLGGFGSSGC